MLQISSEDDDVEYFAYPLFVSSLAMQLKALALEELERLESVVNVPQESNYIIKVQLVILPFLPLK